MPDNRSNNERDKANNTRIDIQGVNGPLENLDLLDQKVAEIRAALKAGEPLSMGRTNLLSGILQSLRYSAASW